MVRKVIAVVLLVAMGAWAEMALAPMLAMHAGHMRPGHELAADMPANHSHHHSEHQQARALALPCCPDPHQAQPEAALIAADGAPACDDPHNCCFRQDPQSVPAPMRDVQKLSREIAPAAVVQLPPAREAAGFAPHDSALELSPPPDVHGMILRV